MVRRVIRKTVRRSKKRGGSASSKRGSASSKRGSASSKRGSATSNRGSATSNRGSATSNRGRAMPSSKQGGDEFKLHHNRFHDYYENEKWYVTDVKTYVKNSLHKKFKQWSQKNRNICAFNVSIVCGGV